MNGAEWFSFNWQRIREDDPTTTLKECGRWYHIQTMNDEEWEQLGRDISNNTHLKNLALYQEALNDQKMSFLFED